MFKQYLNSFPPTRTVLIEKSKRFSGENKLFIYSISKFDSKNPAKFQRLQNKIGRAIALQRNMKPFYIGEYWIDYLNDGTNIGQQMARFLANLKELNVKYLFCYNINLISPKNPIIRAFVLYQLTQVHKVIIIDRTGAEIKLDMNRQDNSVAGIINFLLDFKVFEDLVDSTDISLPFILNYPYSVP